MKPLYYLYYCEYTNPNVTDEIAEHIGDIRTLGDILNSGVLSPDTAMDLVKRIGAPKIRELIVPRSLHEVLINYGIEHYNWPDEVIANLWRDDLTQKDLLGSLGRMPVLIVPIVSDEPKGFEIEITDGEGVAPIIKELSRGHTFMGKIYGVVLPDFKRHLVTESPDRYWIQSLEYLRPFMRFVFQNEGDAVIVSALYDDFVNGKRDRSVDLSGTSSLGLGSSVSLNSQSYQNALNTLLSGMNKP